jgi:hypothetical protein
MDAFVSRKRRHVSVSNEEPGLDFKTNLPSASETDEEESTDYKLAILVSLHPDKDEGTLLEALLASNGSVELALESLKLNSSSSPRKKPATSAARYQSSLSSCRVTRTWKDGTAKKPLTRKGKTVHLYSPKDIETHTPCSIIYNFLPIEEADALLQDLLEEAPTYDKTSTFQLFDREVSSPHTFCLYVDSWDEAEQQKTEYVYDGRKVKVCLLLLLHAASACDFNKQGIRIIYLLTTISSTPSPYPQPPLTHPPGRPPQPAPHAQHLSQSARNRERRNPAAHPYLQPLRPETTPPIPPPLEPQHRLRKRLRRPPRERRLPLRPPDLPRPARRDRES